MATYVIGDVHGCFVTLERLLAKLDLRPKRDHLWLTGDLVNRGPDSLAVLRWAKDTHERMGEHFVTVLGNHDLHLLARAHGIAKRRASDTLDAVLEAADRKPLLRWLRGRPLLHRRREVLLVHAGLLPAWKPRQAEQLARAVEQRLGTKKGLRQLLAFRTPPGLDAETLALRRALHALTRLRTLDARGRPGSFSGPPERAPKGQRPWFAIGERRSRKAEVVFGHWAALGVLLEPGVIALDSGAAWGGKLSAVRLGDRKLFQVKAKEIRG